MSKRMIEEVKEDDEWVKSKFSRLENSDVDEDDDEEDGDDEEKYKILSKDDIEGQEDSGITHDGEVQITPFNMDEELEEGHFDTDGMYHWNRDNLLRDNWLENIDWVKIKPRGENQKMEQDSDSESELFFDEVPLYREMLTLMNSKETVSSALRRHGGSKSLSASERLKLKKAGIDVSKNDKSNSETVTKLTELADTILSKTGNMDIYQLTYEQIENIIKKTNKKKQATDINCTANDLDMYSDDFDSKEKVRLAPGSSSSSNTVSTMKETQSTMEPQWEYKKNIDDDNTDGPHSTSQMIKWIKEKFFKERVWVRKYGSEGQFYSSDRMDFELYI